MLTGIDHRGGNPAGVGEGLVVLDVLDNASRLLSHSSLPGNNLIKEMLFLLTMDNRGEDDDNRAVAFDT